MYQGIIWCPHCGNPHKLGTTICRATGKSIERGVHRDPNATHPLVGTLVDGKYLLNRVIGRGGMGVVFEAENRILRRRVAVKLVLDQTGTHAFERLQREAQIIAALQHPNICNIYDFGWLTGAGPYLVTERLFGETLDSRTQRERQLSVSEVVGIATDVLSALHAAHGQQIVHRDLKPHNIFLVDRLGCRPLAKLLDFGLAKDLSGDGLTKLTMPGFAMGTWQYMSPEQLMGEKVSVHSDLFATAIIIYELLAGVHPFAARVSMEMRRKILQVDPAPLTRYRPDVPAELDAVVTRGLRKLARGRFPDAITFQHALVRAAGDLGAESTEESTIPDSTSTG